MEWMTQASTSAQRSDAVFFAVLAVSFAMLLLITLAMVFFVIPYSRKRHPQADQIEGNTALEITWTLITGLIFLAIFYFGWTNYTYMRAAPRDAMVVEATGRQWNWSFKYPNGKQTGVLYAVLGKPTKVELRSADVIHGFFVPAFRLKADAVPGQVNTTWFEPTRMGSFDIECTVICGVSHAVMLSKVVVVSEESFKAWYFGDENAREPGREALAQASTAITRGGDPGVKVMQAYGCLSCHSMDGTPMVAPSFKGMLGRREEVMVEGRPVAVVADEAQLRLAIRNPLAKPVRGYPLTMPPYRLSDPEMDAVMVTIRGLK